MMQTNINVQSLTVKAALTGKCKHVYHAAAFDPHTAAESRSRLQLYCCGSTIIYCGVALRRANQMQTITAPDAPNNTGDGTSPSIGQAHIIVKNDCNNWI